MNNSKTPNKSTSLVVEIIILVSCVVIISTFAVGFYSYLSYRDSSIEKKSDSLLAIAKFAATLIDPVEYREIMSTMEKNEYHHQLADKFTNLAIETGIFFIHAGELDPDIGFTGFVEARHLTDMGTDLGEIGYSSQYPLEAFDAMQFGLTFVSPPYNAEDYGLNVPGGIVLVAYAPVFDENGKTIAIVSASIIDTEIYASVNIYMLNLFAIITLITMVSIWIPFFYVRHYVAKPLKLLREASNKISQGEIDFFIPDIKSENEIGLLTKDFKHAQAVVKNLNDEIDKLAVSASKGDLSQKINSYKFEGGWKNLASELNYLLDTMALHNIRLSEANMKAELASRAKSDFLATMSHEIRTPMNAIIGISQIQLNKEDLTEESKTALKQIYSSGTGLLGIINDILDLSKIETGKMELHPVDYDLPSLINDAMQINIVRVGSKPIELILDIDETLPSRMFGDELRLKQILNNLLSNGIKYTEEGFVKLSINHKVDKDDIFLRFVIEDTGQGMKPEDMEKMFTEYTRFNEDANRTTEGAGIGLTITKKLVEMMNGTIEVTSEYGKGSVFTVTVLQKSVDCEPVGAELADNLRNFTFSGEKQFCKMQIIREPMPYGRVLVVDDVETNLYVAEGLMAPYGLTIETAISGFKALEMIECVTNDYDIIFMDHMMPKMDGIETTQKLRGMGYKGVIVALTANAMVGNAEMFKQNGFDGFIAKPIDVRDLNAVLNKYVRDKYPEEAIKYKPLTGVNDISEILKSAGVNPKLLAVFRRDAEKAVLTLKETATNGDIKLYVTTVHAMRSALLNIGEAEKSKLAGALEDAGNNGDIDFINANTQHFIKVLEELIIDLCLTETLNDGNDDIKEDTTFLKEQLLKVLTACEVYDEKLAYDALDLLKEKQWKSETTAILENIHEALFFRSDFDEAAKIVDKTLL